MKLLVETKDSLQVVGVGDEMHARHNRPSVVVSNAFITTHISAGNLVMLAQLTDEASDKAFAKAWLEAKDDEGRERLKSEFAAKHAPEGAKPKSPAK